MRERKRQEPRHRHPSMTRRIFYIVGIALICVGALLGVLNIQGILQGHWSDILSLILFPALGLVLAFSAWLYPFSSGKPKLPRLRDLSRSSFQLGGDVAADFPYIFAPIQEAYTRAEEALLDSSKGTGRGRG